MKVSGELANIPITESEKILKSGTIQIPCTIITQKNECKIEIQQRI